MRSSQHGRERTHYTRGHMPAPLPLEIDEAVSRWMQALEARHLRDLTFQEVSGALRALSSCYVERRGRLPSGAALEGRGKRAAFALFYAPIHFLLTSHVVSALGLGLAPGTTIVDAGCGTGAAGAAWALGAGGTASVLGVDRSGWAAAEAAWTWRTLRVRGRAVQGDVAALRPPRGSHAWLAAFVANELPPGTRGRLLERLLASAREGRAVLVLEPLAKAVAPWWDEWVEAFAAEGGEAREWRAATRLPDLVARLDRAAGLDHRELTARSIHIGALTPAGVLPRSAPRRRRPS